MSPAATATATACSSGIPNLSSLKSMCKYTTSRKDSSPCFMSSGNYRFPICRYSIKSTAPVHVLINRTGVAFKESPTGFRNSFTSSDHDGFPISAKKSEHDGVCDSDKWLSALEVKPPAEVPGDPDLLKIPGVGPKNMTKLVENDIAGVSDLKKIYKDKFSRKSNQKMVEYLQSSVGIKNKSHAKSITTFIRKSVREEKKDVGANSNAATPVPTKKVKEDRK
ncbi:hypothetical protein LXL04_031349 [Taraxacum kok-saghyz]